MSHDATQRSSITAAIARTAAPPPPQPPLPLSLPLLADLRLRVRLLLRARPAFALRLSLLAARLRAQCQSRGGEFRLAALEHGGEAFCLSISGGLDALRHVDLAGQRETDLGAVGGQLQRALLKRRDLLLQDQGSRLPKDYKGAEKKKQNQGRIGAADIARRFVSVNFSQLHTSRPAATRAEASFHHLLVASLTRLLLPA